MAPLKAEYIEKCWFLLSFKIYAAS